MSKVAVVLVLASGVMVSVGCGGGGNGSGFHTSVPGNKPLNQLSGADVKQLCTDVAAFVTTQTNGFANKDTICRAAGVDVAMLSNSAAATDPELQAACQLGYAACESSDAGVTATGADGGSTADQCSMGSAPPATCTATVDQYTACVNELTAALTNLFPPCNQVTKAKLAALSVDGGHPSSSLEGGPACKAFTAACPDIPVTSMTSSPLTLRSR